MTKARQQVIRLALRANPDGLSNHQLVAMTGFPQSSVAVCLKNMDDVYIDRWLVRQRGAGPPTAIHVAVPIPEDCPRPGTKSKRKLP